MQKSFLISIALSKISPAPRVLFKETVDIFFGCCNDLREQYWHLLDKGKGC